MQTSFTLAQLADPNVAESEKILRTCVHCGFCTATCPTYVLLGDELDSPRGRIYLIKDMLENDRPATAGGGQAHRPLPFVPCLHDDLPLGGALHASRRSRPHPYRADLPPPAGRSRAAGASGLRTAAQRALPPRPARRPDRQAARQGVHRPRLFAACRHAAACPGGASARARRRLHALSGRRGDACPGCAARGMRRLR